jgi:protein gp37
MQRTSIGYLTHTWNPIAMRCTPVSEGCRNCWAERMARRLASMPKSTKVSAKSHRCQPLYLTEIESFPTAWLTPTLTTL